jgi:hypothetical protein
MRGYISSIVVVAGLMAAGTAQAQSWGIYLGNSAPPPTYAAHWRPDHGARTMDFICSGQRAHVLEERLRHEVDEDEIDDDTADRMHEAIDRLENRQRQECAEGDWRSVREIGGRYDRIGQWMDAAAHGQGWRPRW